MAENAGPDIGDGLAEKNLAGFHTTLGDLRRALRFQEIGPGTGRSHLDIAVLGRNRCCG